MYTDDLNLAGTCSDVFRDVPTLEQPTSTGAALFLSVLISTEFAQHRLSHWLKVILVSLTDTEVASLVLLLHERIIHVHHMSPKYAAPHLCMLCLTAV